MKTIKMVWFTIGAICGAAATVHWFLMQNYALSVFMAFCTYVNASILFEENDVSSK